MSAELVNVAEIFGENVFNDTVMQERLPKKIYKNLKRTIEEGKELDLETADVIAHEMKAVSYTHLTENTHVSQHFRAGHSMYRDPWSH